MIREQDIFKSSVPSTSCNTEMFNFSSEEVDIGENPVSDDHDIYNHLSTNCKVETDMTKDGFI